MQEPIICIKRQTQMMKKSTKQQKKTQIEIVRYWMVKTLKKGDRRK